MASYNPFLNCLSGNVIVYLGSRREKYGHEKAYLPPFFCFVALLEITKPLFHSEPVAGIVKTVPSLHVGCGVHGFDTMSHGSCVAGIPDAAWRNFVPSITERIVSTQEVRSLSFSAYKK